MSPKVAKPQTSSSSTGDHPSSPSSSSSSLFFPRLPRRFRAKLSFISLPSAMTVYTLVLLTYFLIVSGIVYDVIVEPPGIGSTQDKVTGTVRPIVFLPGRVNGQYIIEGLSSGFMFVLGGLGIVLLDLALDKNRDKSVKVTFAIAGIAFITISYVMASLFLRIKIPGYLR